MLHTGLPGWQLADFLLATASMHAPPNRCAGLIMHCTYLPVVSTRRFGNHGGLHVSV